MEDNVETAEKPKFTLAHVGINSANEGEALQNVNALSALFELPVIEGSANYFMDDSVEFMKTPGPGKAGHIAFAVENIEAAILYLEQKGVLFERKNFKYDEAGKIAAAYMAKEVAGFALHLIERK